MSSREFFFHHWLVKPDANEIVGANGPVKLDHKVMQLLVYFVQNTGKDLAKEEILGAVWGPGVFSEEVLTVAVSNLRKALGDEARAPKYLKTIPRFGYRMLAAAAPAPTAGRRKSFLEILDDRVGLRFLIVAFLIALFLIFLLTRRHIGPFH